MSIGQAIVLLTIVGAGLTIAAIGWIIRLIQGYRLTARDYQDGRE